MSTVGRLEQAYVTLTWGGKNLSYYDDGAGGYQILAQNVTITLNKGEAAPECTFQIAPNPIGFEVFSELKASALSEPWTVEMGYVNGSKVKWKFQFAGVNLTTGHDPKLEITGTSIVKGCWTDNKISYTMEKEIALSEFPKFLQSKVGDCAKDLKISFTGQALEQASTIMIKSNQTQRTPHVILMDTLRQHGMDLQIGDTMFDGEVVISYTPNLEGETEKDKPAVQDGKQEAQPAKGLVFILGPGQMENITRKQAYTLGQRSTKRNASKTETPSNDTEQEGVVEADSLPQSGAATGTTTTATLGKSNPSSTETGIVKGSPLDKKARQAFSSVFTSEMNTEFFMTPYMVGIKPRDFIAIPSLKGPGSYIEDWMLERVTYTQQATGGIRISVQGWRPFTGDAPMLDSGTISAIQGVVSSLTTPALWSKLYWVQGPEVDYPLAQ